MEKEEYQRMYKQETSFWWYKTLHELVQTIVEKHLSGNHLQILDAGCGTGRMMELLLKYGEVEGLDFSEEAINLSKKRGLQNLQIGNLNTWYSANNKYDLIVCLDVIVSKEIKDDIEVLGKFFEALKENGILILNNAAFEILKRQHDNIVHGVMRYRKKKLIKELKNIGFQIQIATYRMPYLFLIILMRKFVQKIIGGAQEKIDNKPISKWLNQILLLVGRIENKMLLTGLSMPFGSSLFIVGEKP